MWVALVISEFSTAKRACEFIMSEMTGAFVTYRDSSLFLVDSAHQQWHLAKTIDQA